MQKQLPVLAACLLISCWCSAQSVDPKVKAMLDAENAFASMSKEKSTKQAFLQYLSDSSVMFDQLKPVKGKKSWQERAESNSVLFWWPVFAGISQDGKLGFSTGPWEYSKSKTDPPSFFGYYATVWEQLADGSWKMAADIGISLPKAEDKSPALVVSKNQGSAKPTDIGDAKHLLWKHALEYDLKLNSSNCTLLPMYYTNDARVLRENRFPYITVEQYQDDTKATYRFNTTGMGMSATADLGYTYGVASAVVAENGNERQIHHYFMKVWKLENGEWKIVLDVLGGA
jgi:ketosteroid isomerase-like protein